MSQTRTRDSHQPSHTFPRQTPNSCLMTKSHAQAQQREKDRERENERVKEGERDRQRVTGRE